MVDTNEYRLRWVAQGETQWESWWVNLHGKTKTHIPTEAEHVSFANFELANDGLPQIYDVGRIHAIRIVDGELPIVTEILERHGFVVIDEGFRPRGSEEEE